LPASSIPGVSDSPEKTSEIYNNIKSLDTIFESKSYNDVQQILDTHFFGKDTSTTVSTAAPAAQAQHTSQPSSEPVYKDSYKDVETESSDMSEEERKMQEILNGL